jgi:hypothetical protein
MFTDQEIEHVIIAMQGDLVAAAQVLAMAPKPRRVTISGPYDEPVTEIIDVDNSEEEEEEKGGPSSKRRRTDRGAKVDVDLERTRQIVRLEELLPKYLEEYNRAYTVREIEIAENRLERLKATIAELKEEAAKAAQEQQAAPIDVEESTPIDEEELLAINVRRKRKAEQWDKKGLQLESSDDDPSAGDASRSAQPRYEDPSSLSDSTQAIIDMMQEIPQESQQQQQQQQRPPGDEPVSEYRKLGAIPSRKDDLLQEKYDLEEELRRLGLQHQVQIIDSETFSAMHKERMERLFEVEKRLKKSRQTQLRSRTSTFGNPIGFESAEVLDDISVDSEPEPESQGSKAQDPVEEADRQAALKEEMRAFLALIDSHNDIRGLITAFEEKFPERRQGGQR